MPCLGTLGTIFDPLFSLTRCKHHATDDSIPPFDPEPGVWDVVTLEGLHHLSLVPLWLNSKKQQEFWMEVGNWLCAVEALKETTQNELPVN
jgi:hypothetical protein